MGQDNTPGGLQIPDQEQAAGPSHRHSPNRLTRNQRRKMKPEKREKERKRKER